jgi:3-oxoacyl-[acyl-carrier-protein] synthase II
MDGKMPYYINGIGIISPQKTFDNDHFLSEVSAYDHNVLTCITPDFKVYINPAQLRRLSRMLRIGMTTAIICLRDAKVQIPDGIITATGYGFLEETEKFLRELLERQEKQLTPTYFMQGTYNALAGLVALSIKCTGYNNTYVSRGFAFENALQDAMMQLAENKGSNFLVGTYDEAAGVLYTTSLREHYYKTEHVNNLHLFESTTTGSIQGEGSAFFNVSGISSNSTWCTLMDLQIVYTPENEAELSAALTTFLNANALSIHEIDVWINGVSGDPACDGLLVNLEKSIFQHTPQVRFKHLCGEYCTAISFATWLGASILKKQFIPEIIKVPSTKYSKKLETILIVNQYLNRNYSFLLLRKF